jgi:TPR repeat protein
LAVLITRGDAYVEARDLISARLYFERAAEAGDGRAAVRMGKTFDPAFLARAGIRAMQGHRQQAFFWYQRASDFGDAYANELLKN